MVEVRLSNLVIVTLLAIVGIVGMKLLVNKFDIPGVKEVVSAV